MESFPQSNKPVSEEEGDNSLDYNSLEGQRRSVVAELEEKIINLPLEEKTAVVSRVFEHSIEDGFDLSQRIGLDRSEIAQCFSRQRFVSKHQNFVHLLSNKLLYLANYVPWGDQGIAEGEEMEDLAKLMRSASPSTEIKTKTKEGQRLQALVDDYYVNFIPLRGVAKKEKPVETRSPGERIGENALLSAKQALGSNYYTGPILERIKSTFGVEDLNDIKSPRTREALLPMYSNIISEADLRKMLSKLGKIDPNLAIDSPEIQSIIQDENNRYRPLDITYRIKNQEARKNLLSELKSSLSERGFTEKDFEIKLDQNTGQYEVISKVKESKNRQGNFELKRKNLRLIMEVPDKYITKPDDPYYETCKKALGKYFPPYLDKDGNLPVNEEVFIVGGKVYRKVGSKRVNYQDFIIYPDGTKSKIFYVLTSEDAKEGDGKLWFPARLEHENDNTWFGIVNDKGEEIKDSKFTSDSGSGFVLHNGDIYWGGAEIESQNSNSYPHAIFKGNQILESFNCKYLKNLRFIGDTMVFEANDYPQNSTRIKYGDQWLGPYREDLSMDKNIDDDLVFAANSKKEGEVVIYSEGKEKTIQTVGVVGGVKKVDGKIFIILNSKKFAISAKGEAIKTWIIDENGNKITEPEEDKNISFLDNDKELSYLSHDSKNDTTKVQIGNNAELVQGGLSFVGVFQGNYLFSDVRWGGDGDKIFCFGHGELKFNKRTSYKIDKDTGDLFIINPIEGKNNKDSQSRRVYKYVNSLDLTKSEQRKLILLNLLEKEEVRGIENYFDTYHNKGQTETIKEKLLRAYESSQGLAANLSAAIKGTPQTFIDMLPAKQDHLSDQVIERIVRTMYPDLRYPEKNSWSSFGWAKNNQFRNMLESSSSLNPVDGDPKEKQHQDILECREPVSGMVSTGIFGKYQGGGRWSKAVFPVNQTNDGPTHEVTFTAFVPDRVTRLNLPKLVESIIIPGRVKGIDQSGEEKNLEVEVNSLGEGVVVIPEGIKSVIYSQKVYESPKVPDEINERDYKKFRDSFARDFGQDSVEKIARLPDELKVFIKSIEDLPPRDRLLAVEDFVRDNSYYDFDNGEMQEQKFDKSLEDLFDIMRYRLMAIRKKKPELKEALDSKRFAGVCTDFAKLTITLLRASGLVSGFVVGLRSNGVEKMLTTANAHAESYVAWPEENGTIKIIEVDATPAGLTEEEERFLSSLRRPSIRERELMRQKGEKGDGSDSEKRLRDLEVLVRNLDPERIKRLENGELESVLNSILRQVKNSNLSAVERALESARYVGIDAKKAVIDQDQTEETRLKEFLSGSIERARERSQDPGSKGGGKLLSMIEDFSRRYTLDKSVSGREQALDIIEKVLDLSKDYLNPIEYRSAIAVVTYLKAKKMSHS